MPSGSLAIRNLMFCYPSARDPVFEDVSVELPAGWTGLIGASGAGKTTLLRLVAGELSPLRGNVRSPGRVVHCPQRTDAPPDGLAALLESNERGAHALRGRLALQSDWLARWETLSHGERKRAQIATALWHDPQVLTIDEPTNHVDRQARGMLESALRAFRGFGLLVSHDRDLLDALCGRCLVLEPPCATLRAGGYSQARELEEADRSRAERVRSQARRETKRLEREASSRRNAAAQADHRRSKRGLAKKDHDAKEKIDRARVSGKDGLAGRRLRQMQGRLRQAQDRHAAIHVPKTARLRLDLAAEAARRDAVVRLDAQRFDIAPSLPLEIPDLWIGPRDRVALIGPNGAGKSSLVRRVVAQANARGVRHVYLPQEIADAGGREIAASLRALPGGRLGEVLTIVGSLGSDPVRLRESESPSPGEVRKLLLAMGIEQRPHLIVLDEPTNHLDLPSIECLEVALARCECALLLVSHDERFLERLTSCRWEVVFGADGARTVVTRPATQTG